MSIPIATKFLIVDDSASERQAIIRKIRSDNGQHCIEAASGEEALAILKQEPIDVILCDSDMPNMSGLELLKHIRADAKLYPVTFIMIFAQANRDYLLEAIKYGVSSVLVNPYTLDAMVERIEKAIKNPAKLTKPIALTSPENVAIDKQETAPALTILAVDDSPEFLMMLSELFQNEYRVRVAQNGEKALKICGSDNPPDLVLLDVMMPMIDGFEVAKRMREYPNAKHIPIIFITSLADDVDAKLRGLDLGAIDFVGKPIDARVLKMRVQNFMRYIELHKHLQSDYDQLIENARLREVIENFAQKDFAMMV